VLSVFFSRANVRSELSSVATRELSPWLNFVYHAKQTTEELNRLNQTEPTIFVFDVARGKVRTWLKPDCEVSRFFLPRVELYRDFIEEIVGKLWGFATTFGFCVGDYAVENDLVPLFAFQKRNGGRSILFPDPDFLQCKFYADSRFIDTLAFEAKSNTAVFVGSTTGALITLEKIQLGEVPRINAANFFRGHEAVRFFLPNIVGIGADDEVRKAILALDIGGPGGHIAYSEQFSSRFMLSMDGNGACCSRVAISLRSNCVLAKYDSPHVLYYFRLLEPGTHFVPISSNQDVLRLLAKASAEPDRYKAIADNGRVFFDRYLAKSRVVDYARMVLAGYARLVPRLPFPND
jgi:hypothetical protein